jgi:hypothetical protein
VSEVAMAAPPAHRNASEGNLDVCDSIALATGPSFLLGLTDEIFDFTSSVIVSLVITDLFDCNIALQIRASLAEDDQAML